MIEPQQRKGRTGAIFGRSVVPVPTLLLRQGISGGIKTSFH